MKPIKAALRVTKHVSLLIAILCVISSCSKKLSFSTSSIVPDAQGLVKIKKDNNENYAIEINVRNLSQPERLVEPKNLYVVWANTRDNCIRNMGQLESGRKVFSKGLGSSLETITTFEPVDFFITAERKAKIPYPEG